MKKKLALYTIPDVNPDYPEFIHDHNITLIEGGKVAKYLHLERITGVKYDNSLHQKLYQLFKQAKLFGHDYELGFVDSTVGRSVITSEGKIRFEANPFEPLSPNVEYGRAYWLDRHVKAYAIRHELAHIFSVLPFYGIFRENSLLVHFDGGASVGNVSVWLWRHGQLKLIDYGWQLKRLSSLFNANALNFFILGVKRKQHNSLPGKYMGFAGWGQYDKNIEAWLKENDFFEDIWHDKRRFFDSAKRRFGWDKKHFDTKDKFLQNIAATVQYYFVRETLEFIKQQQQKVGADYLYFTGGSALNLYLNKRLVESSMFKDVFIPPCTNDSGLSLGAAAYMEWLDGVEVQEHLPYLNNWELDCEQVVDDSTDIPKIARFLMEGKVIGICNGFGEVGPRALGNRSIVALPHSKSLSRLISQKMKGREWYRPLAPVMLYHVAQQVIGQQNFPLISRYMLINFKILPQFYDKLAGVVHVDGTARVQVLFNREDNPFLWDLLTYLYKYGVLGLINTSFNFRGKPIVHFESQAYEQAREMNLDGLVINGRFYQLK